MKKSFLAILITLLPVISFAQQLKGYVFDTYNHTPLASATVVYSKTASVITDENGEFTIPCTDSVKVFLLGYETWSGAVGNCDRVLNIGLIPGYLNLNEIVISGTTSQTNLALKQPMSLVVLSRPELTRDHGLFLENSVNLIPGVRMEKRTASGGQRITIRGYGNSTNFNGAGYRAYINGIPVTDAAGITVLDDIDFSTLGKVEIIKGPASSLYGAGIGGVVNMYTLRPQAQTTAVSQEVIAGSYGLFRTNTRVQSANDNSSILLNYGHQNYDSYRVHSASQKDFASFIGDFRANNKQTLSVYLGYNNSNDQLAGQLDSASYFTKENKGEAAYLANNGHVQFKSFRSGVSHKYAFTKHFSNLSTVYFSGYTQDQTFAVGLNSNEAQNIGGRTEFNLNFDFEKWVLNGTVGGEIQSTTAFNKSYRMAQGIVTMPSGDLEVRTQQAFAFTQWDVKLPLQFLVTVGASANFLKFGIADRMATSANPQYKDQSGTKTFDPVITPRIAVMKTFGENLTAYFNLSQGYTPPATNAVVIPAIGKVNTELKPEFGTLYEIGSKGNLLKKKLSYQLALFQLNVGNKLTTQAETDSSGTVLYSYTTNAGSQVNRGLELAVAYAVINDEEKFVSVVKPFVSYTYSNFEYDNFKSDNNNNAKTVDYTGNKVAGVPPHLFNAGIDVALKFGLYLHATYQYVDKMPLTFDNRHFAPAFSLLGAKIGYQRELGKHIAVDVFAGGENLTNSLYYTMVFLNGNYATSSPNIYLPGPYTSTFYGGANLKYKF